MSSYDSSPTILDSASALELAALASLNARGLVVRERDNAERNAAPYVTRSVREECGCGLSDDHHELTLSIHVRGLDRKLKEVMRLADDAERAALTVGTHLADWQILQISVERTRILRHKGEWTGCLSFRAMLTRKD
ncbi:hypothetical protein [Sphingopyxis sp.]|uniref:hypothetical protein n=1 Tax=Sphingopyxis sp. TaxID=1908224 RepID=UPI001D223F08|nr:hypothetical protein [Sphingopyxis sp.]MBW8294303.1 hypothetical protein [Sphingopyxis sp.]